MNYEKLMAAKPMKLKQITNQLNQIIDLYEDPKEGDLTGVIAVYHAEKIADRTDFFDTADFFPSSDYNPVFYKNSLICFYEYHHLTKNLCRICKTPTITGNLCYPCEIDPEQETE
jgi:hypothetical protein